MLRSRDILGIVLSVIFITGCSVTRRIPDDSYLLVKTQIEADKEVPKKSRIVASDVKKYLRQKPNKRFLGTNFYAWVYTLANPEKQNRWNKFKRRIGQAPVLLDVNETAKSRENLKIYLDSRGYYSSSVGYSVDTVSKRKKAIVRYTLHQGKPYRISNFTYEVKDRFLEPILMTDTVNRLLHKGDIFDITVLDQERSRIAQFLHNRGYYNFSVNNIEYEADTISQSYWVDVKMIVKQHLQKYNAKGKPILENHSVYRLRNVNIFPRYNANAARMRPNYFSEFDTMQYRGLNIMYRGKKTALRPAVLRPNVLLFPNSLYNADQVNTTYSNLVKMGYFKSARIEFTEVADTTKQRYVTYVASGHDALDTASPNYTHESYLDCNIYCTPALKQSFKTELEASTTSSFYGLKATIGYQNRNIFRGAETLELQGTVGYEYMKAPKNSKRHAVEFGVSAGISFPKFLFIRSSPLRNITTQHTKLELSFNYQNRPYYRRSLTSAVLSYSWKNRGNSSFVFRPISVNLVDVGYIDEAFFESLQSEYLKNSYKSQLIMASSGSYIYNNSMTSAGRGRTVFRINYELAGNLVDGLMHLFSSPTEDGYYKFLGIRYSQYFRTDMNVSHTISLGEKTELAGRFVAGVGVAYGNSSAIPFDRLFYVGGSNSMRGWVPRTLGPGSSPLPDRVVYPAQLGDLKLEANLELRFPIWGVINGGLFFDAGNVWFVKEDKESTTFDSAIFRFKDFYKQLGFNTGIGLRIDIKFVILRLDWGIQLHNPNRVEGERWIHDFRWKNTALNFGVGYAF